MPGSSYLDPYGQPLRAPWPACPGRVPMRAQASGLLCPRCRGELLDRADAEKLLSKFPLPPLPETDPARQRSRVCGLCGGAMASHRVQSGQTLEICATCSGVFLEFGEARLIYQAAMLVQQRTAPVVIADGTAGLRAGRRPSAPSTPPGAAAASAPVHDAPIGLAAREESAPAKPSAGSGPLGILVLLFRLSPVALLVGAVWYFRDTGVRTFQTLANVPSSYQSMTDMAQARNAVAAEIASDRWPVNLSLFLRETLQSDRAHLDRWGTPYELRGSNREPVLASCGADRVCNSEDDVLLPLFRKVAADAPDPGVDAKIRD